MAGEESLDSDSDGLGNLAEQSAGTDPFDADSDDYGLLDGEEGGALVFLARPAITTTADGGRTVFAGDVDGDGDLDVLSASWYEHTVAWYENFDRVSLARKNMDAHLRGHAMRGLRTLFADAYSNDCILINSPERAIA